MVTYTALAILLQLTFENLFKIWPWITLTYALNPAPYLPASKIDPYDIQELGQCKLPFLILTEFVSCFLFLSVPQHILLSAL